MWKKWRFDLLLLVLLLILAYIPWRQLPELVIRGDGFVYMLSATQNEFLNRHYFYTGFENSAIFFGIFLPKLFSTNIALYFTFSLFVMMVINVLFYIMARVIFKNKIIAFSAAFIFALNYFGNFDMYSQHCYCFFLERVIPVIFMIPAFSFLHLFLEKQKPKYYLISLLLYFLGIGIGHFSLLFTAPYLLYPFFWYFVKNKKIISRIKGVWIGGSYLLISGFFVLIQRIHESGFGPKLGLVEFLLKPQITQYPEKILRQLTYWSQYPPLVKNIGTYPISLLDSSNAEILAPYIFIAYLVVSVIIFKVLPKARALLLTTIFGTLSIFYLNSWFGQYDVLYQPGANRYLYFPTILLSLFWALFLWVLLKNGKNWGKTIFVVLLLAYFSLNSWLIVSNLKQIFIWDQSTKAFFSHIVATRKYLSTNTLVVVPRPEFWVQEDEFFTTHLGKGNVRYMSENNGYLDWKKIASSSAHVIKLSYDNNCDCVLEERIK